MRKIIVPVDFSDSTEKLLDKAMEFAKLIDAELALIHVASNDIGFVVGEMGFQYFPEVEEQEIKFELRELNRLQDIVKSNNLVVKHILKQGLAGDTIIDYANDEKADYIVVGSHGRSGIYDIIIGSLTKEITRKSKIPVLVIPCTP